MKGRRKCTLVKYSLMNRNISMLTADVLFKMIYVTFNTYYICVIYHFFITWRNICFHTRSFQIWLWFKAVLSDHCFLAKPFCKREFCIERIRKIYIYSTSFTCIPLHKCLWIYWQWTLKTASRISKKKTLKINACSLTKTLY